MKEKNLPYVLVIVIVAAVALIYSSGINTLTGNAVLERCVDSDPANDHYVRGEVAVEKDNKTDTCSQDNKKVTQYYCKSSKKIGKTKSFRCLYGCQDGACIPLAEICGNGILDIGEECDDGNLVSGDGCSESCEEEENFNCQTTSVCSIIV
jgi:cysteine-rich repeat protein